VKTHLANFREGPGTTIKILRVLRRGARLEVLETRNDWFRVRLDDGQEGWVAESVTSAAAP
jgi:N-acetylmuramoyl-L-alanine amidase